MEEEYLKKIMVALIVGVLIILSFFLLKPILLSIILGILLAFILFPIYNWLEKRVNSKNVSASIICIAFALVLLMPIWFLTPVAINQSVKFYQTAQKTDFITPFKQIFPAIFASDEFSAEFGSTIHSFVTKIANILVNMLGDLILNFPKLFFQSTVVFFTLFFVLRDKEQLVVYLKSLSPFSKEIEKKLFDYSTRITASVLYGQVVVGIIQGIIAGIGFAIFGIPNFLLLTIFAIITGIFPIIGTAIIWVPVAVYSFLYGNTFATFGVVFFGVISSSIDNFLKPFIISKRTDIHSSILIIGMVGGFFLFGVLGFILGPLILSYLLILLETYRNKKVPGIFVQNKTS